MLCETTTITVLKYIGYWCAVTLFNYLHIPNLEFSILALLMVIDFLSWVSKQIRLNPQELTSHKAWLWIQKKVWTLASVIVIALMLSVISFWWTEKYITSFIALLVMSETYSILQNIYIIRTWEKITEYDVVSRVIRWVWDIIANAIEKTLESKK